MTVQTAGAGRKERFKASLALGNVTAVSWAEAHGISVSHLNQVLNGRESRKLLAEVDAFIALYLGET